VAELHATGIDAFFVFGASADFKDASMTMAIAGQGGLGLPDRDYFLKSDPKSVALREQYVEHVGRMVRLAGASSSAAAADAQHVAEIETALANGALDAVSRRDPTKIYHKMAPAELQALTPSFQWARYFDAIGAPPIDALNVTEPDFFRTLGGVLAGTPLDAIRSYLRLHVIHASANLLPTAFVDENF